MRSPETISLSSEHRLSGHRTICKDRLDLGLVALLQLDDGLRLECVKHLSTRMTVLLQTDLVQYE